MYVTSSLRRLQPLHRTIRITRDACGMGHLGRDSDKSTDRKRLAPNNALVRHQREVFAAALRHRQSRNQVLGLTPVSSRRAEHNARPQLQESFVQAVPLMEVATSLPSNS